MTDPTIAAENYVADYDRDVQYARRALPDNRVRSDPDCDERLSDRDEHNRDVLYAAIHMLHEQAHGNVAFRTCPAEPCRSLYYLPITGPAPRVLA